MLIKITCIGIGIIIGVVVMLVAYVMYTEESDDVVSCKDCKWYNSKGYCEHWLRETDEDDFCSYQERRESGYEDEWRKWDSDYSVRSNLEQFRVDEPHHSGEATEMVGSQNEREGE